MTEEGKVSAKAEQGDGALTNSVLIECLRVRAADCGQKSMTARLKAVIDLVEAVLARGYDRSQVREWLVSAGFEFTPDSFDSALTRVRRRRLDAGHSGKRRVAGRRDAETPTPAHDVEVPTSTAVDEAAGIGEPKRTPFADVFMEHRDLVAGRRK
ncbi:hypothetical protein [Burkholderia pseudomallei]|uniref:hypothetical protein n=1 Tax=Burkholderia pseudomallei TaxID=28450 RepID=UPI0011C21271|nr:hypothetical protein [Burkholderia pseudomallei]